MTIYGITVDHDYRVCVIEDCHICQDLVDGGQVMACDECDTPGEVFCGAWRVMKDGRTLCESCFESEPEIENL